jgi:predicted O-methyltransferase YrrM
MQQAERQRRDNRMQTVDTLGCAVVVDPRGSTKGTNAIKVAFMTAGETSNTDIVPSRVDEGFARPDWIAGAINPDDVAFLGGLVARHRPETAIEIGVASGYSSAVLLRALRALDPPNVVSPRRLVSFDVQPNCYFDRTRAVGAAVAELVPELVPMWQLAIGRGAIDVRRVLGPRLAQFAFIDGSHDHPWPALDMLAILPGLEPGSWVALHDTIPRRRDTGPGFAVGRGPLWLFEGWRGAKELSGLSAAIQIPKDRNAAATWVLSILARPWEAASTGLLTGALDELGRVYGIDLSIGRPEADDEKDSWIVTSAKAVAATGRPVILWGTGETTQRVLGSERARDVAWAAAVVPESTAQDDTIDGVGVISSPELARRLMGGERPFLVFTHRPDTDDLARVRAMGLRIRFDYVVP